MFRNILTHGSVLFFLLVEISTGFDQACNTCGQIDFNVEQAVQDRFLDDGRMLATKTVKNDSECFVECSLDCRCMSFSVCGKSCHLSAGNRKLVKNSLRHKPGCRYYDFPPFESACVSSPSPPRLCCLPSSPLCFNGATCVVNITDTTRRFACQCPTGYYGNQCQIKEPKTCLDYLSEPVKPISGKYTIVDASETSYEVFCDFDSEEDMAWTLFESFDINHQSYLRERSFTENHPENEHDLNWKLFRLSKSVMTEISSHSTFWRATCSYSAYGVDFRDYIRVRLSTVNPLTLYAGVERKCLTVDFFDIKGTNCVNCTQMIYQNNAMLCLLPWHSREKQCTFDTSKVEHQCDDGKYARLLGRYDKCSDPKYRCSERTTSTTEFWFGAVKEKNEN